MSSAENLNEISSVGELDDLDDYSLMGVLDKLDYEDLLNLAMLSSRVRHLVVDFYISKYGWNDQLIYIHITESGGVIYFGVRPKTFLAKKYDQMLFVLRYFGHIFTRLGIFITSMDYVNEIQFLINTHCSAASQELQITEPYVAIPRSVNIRFENVTSVALFAFPINVAKFLRLDTAFPQMRKLNFNCELDLNHHFPHLTEITFQHNSFEWDVSEFVRLNPQLHSVDSPIFNNSMFFSSINELPNLENLWLAKLPLKRYNNRNSFETVQFKNVKNFTLTLYDYDDDSTWNELSSQMLEAIQFENLSSFTVYTNNYYTLEPLEALVGMVAKNALLQNVIFDSKISTFQLSRMVASLKQLKDVTFAWWEPRQPFHTWNRFLQDLIESNHKLEKITVKLPLYSQIDFESSSMIVPSGWSYIKTIGLKSHAVACFERNI